MGKGYGSRAARWVLPAAMFPLVAWALWSREWSQPTTRIPPEPAQEWSGMASPGQTLAPGPALRYAEALREGDCEAVMARTARMRVRLRNAQAAGEDVAAVREQLCDELQDRSPGGNRVRPEGVEDRYLFPPGSEIEAIGTDGGRDDLSRPVRSRTWLRVTYPAPDRALCDEAGRPIRSVVVGVSLSADGYVEKAGIVGNLEIDRGSIRYDWDRVPGG